MAVLSLLKFAQHGLHAIKSPFLRAAKQSNNVVAKLGGIRQMGGHGGKRVMHIQPSNFEWRQFLDKVHYYIFLGVVPLGAVILYSNVVVGPGTLSEIPDDYEPREWEYYKHPIQRFFARYIYDTPQREYEKMLHVLHKENEKKNLRLLEWKVKALMRDRGDYKAWYYIPTNERAAYKGRIAIDSFRDQAGKGDTHLPSTEQRED